MMAEPNFPGVSDEFPEVDRSFPTVAISDGVLTLASATKEAKSSAIHEKDFEQILSLSRNEIDHAILMTQSSNSSGHISRVLLDYRKALGDSPSDLNVILVGLTASRLRNYADALIAEQSLDGVTTASLQTIVQHSQMILSSLREWKVFEIRCRSIEFDADEDIASNRLFLNVNSVLEEAADLVSPSLIDAVREYEMREVSGLNEDSKSTHLVSLAKQQVVNNILVSLLREVRSLQNEASAWPGRMIGARILSTLSQLNFARPTNLVFGWIHYAMLTIKKLL